ncbi:MAG: hypothetical protein ABFE07_10780 [Armatimonadia bacterium]
MKKYTRTIVVVAMAGLIAALSGCGGGSGGSSSTEPEKSGNRITTPATMAQLQADLQVLGKTMPEFLQEGAPDVQANTRTLLELLPFGSWTSTRSVPRGRAQWFEVNLTRNYYPTDVAMDARSGDPDLYIFSPLRTYGDESLVWVGYDIGTGDSNIGSFYPSDFGGTGRYLIAVYGYSAATFKLKIW